MDQVRHYFHLVGWEPRHREWFHLLREYCERNKRVLKFYRLLTRGYVSYEDVYECSIEGGTRAELHEFMRDWGLDKVSTFSEKQL